MKRIFVNIENRLKMMFFEMTQKHSQVCYWVEINSNCEKNINQWHLKFYGDIIFKMCNPETCEINDNQSDLV